MKTSTKLCIVAVILWISLFIVGLAYAGPVHKGWNYLHNKEKDVAVLVYLVAGDRPIAIITDDAEGVFHWAVNISNDLNKGSYAYDGNVLTLVAAQAAVEETLMKFYWR